MTHDEFEHQERAARDIIQTFTEMSRTTQASPEFLARVMARAAQLPAPHPRVRDRMLEALVGILSRRARLALAIVLVLALVGAVPQYAAWVRASLLGVPVNTLYEARVQEALWEKNFACATQLDQHSRAYAAIADGHVNVVVWACPSGDVLVALGSATEPAARRSIWVPLEPHVEPKRHLSWLVQQAFAAQTRPPAGELGAPMIRVLEQQWLPNKHIKRRVQLANNQCREEIINPRTGHVVESRPVPCH